MKLIKSTFWAFIIATLMCLDRMQYSRFRNIFSDFKYRFYFCYFEIFYVLYYGLGAGFYHWKIGDQGSHGPARLFKREPKHPNWLKGNLIWLAE